MKRADLLIAILLSLSLLRIAGCEKAEMSVATSTFQPEYDFISGYSLSDGFGDVITAFEKCNTTFAYISSDEIPNADTVGYFLTTDHMEDFRDIWADCDTANGECIWLNNLLYMAGVKKYLGIPTSGGVTLYAGVKGYAMCMIFVERLREIQQAQDQSESPYYSETSIIMGAVVHELGHTRGNLKHACKDTDPTVFNGVNHTFRSCIMGNSLIWAPCALDYDSPLESYPESLFCDSCKARLRRITW